MELEKVPFRAYSLDGKKQDVFSIKISKEQREVLESCKKVLQQKKDSTAIKQLAFEIGAEVVLRSWMGKMIGAITDNKRKNQRLGIADFD